MTHQRNDPRMTFPRKFCSHYNDKGKSAIHKADFWTDTGGVEWREDECHQCGRLWRVRFVSLAKSLLFG